MSHALLQQQTLLPPEPDHGRDELHRLAALFEHAPTAGQAVLVGPDGVRVALPYSVYEALRQVVAALTEGLAITLAPHTMKLTTQQTADMLSISRPTLVALLERGEIPFEKVGRHRRVLLTDLLDYQQRARQQRKVILLEMTQDAEDLQHVDGFEVLDD